MSKYDNQTPVIFRKWPKSELVSEVVSGTREKEVENG